MRYKLNDHDIAAEELEGEVIAIHLQSGSYYSMQGTAADIWRGVMGGSTSDEIAAAIKGNPSEVASFVNQLLSEDIITAAPDLTAGKPLTPLVAYAQPELQKYTDMQNMLLVDPIHEVSEEGWPLIPEKK